jgi:hypothetical protein
MIGSHVWDGNRKALQNCLDKGFHYCLHRRPFRHSFFHVSLIALRLFRSGIVVRRSRKFLAENAAPSALAPLDQAQEVGVDCTMRPSKSSSPAGTTETVRYFAQDFSDHSLGGLVAC